MLKELSMYFITNQEDYIVAASKSFLDKIGYRDICNISMAIKNQQITFLDEDDEIKVSTLNENLKYTIINMHSAFGKLNLYQLRVKDELSSTLNDDNIDYLRKIKSGTIDLKDEQFDIPQIANDDNIPTSLTKDIDAKEINSSLENNKKENIENNDNIEVIKIFDNNSDEEKSSFEPKDYSSTNYEEESGNKTQLVKSVESKSNNLSNLKDNVTDKIKKENNYLEDLEDLVTNESLEKIANIEHKDIAVDAKLKENFADEISDDLSLNEFIKEVETKDNLEDIDKDLSKDSEEKRDKDSKTTSTTEKKDEKKSGLSRIKSRLFPWGKSSNDDELDIELEDNDSAALKSATEIESKENIIDEVKADLSKEITIEEIKPEIDESIDVIDDNIENLTTQNKEIKDEIEPQESNIKKSEPENLNRDSDNLKNRLISMQVDRVDLEENAKRLSINNDNYKMLLENYIDEINNHKNDLEVANLNNIEMLADASRLLSLDIVTEKLELIAKDDNRQEHIQELYLIVSKLQDRLNNNKFKQEEKKPKEVKESDIDEFDINTTPPSIPEELIDITSAEKLLMQIKMVKVTFDPQRASDDLNLPKSLILEFVEDFIQQAKTHLDQIVQAYQRSDIKTLQTTAHMLKGAASNLRLDEISTTLFKIQKENSLENDKQLIKDFVAQLKGLENEVEKLEM